LARQGPVGLAKLAQDKGFKPAAQYADKCHLCWNVRRFLFHSGLHHDELGPACVYEPSLPQEQTA
jgi:hypothetical protein